MLPTIRKIRIISAGTKRVQYLQLHDGRVCSLPIFTFNLMQSAGVFEVENGMAVN